MRERIGLATLVLGFSIGMTAAPSLAMQPDGPFLAMDGV